MHKLTRIAYNSKGWHQPTGEARKHEASGTYNREQGFGHEDWLFRSDWQIDGWRYAFIEGVNKSHRRLIAAKTPIDLTLFTIEPDRRRRYVATIHGVECLNDKQAQDALELFKKQGWFATMLAEIKSVRGNAAALGDTKWAKHILNVRFRLENVASFPAETYAAANDPVQKLARYMLYDEARIGLTAKNTAIPKHSGSSELPAAKSFQRHAVAAVKCTPEHARMQAKLMVELKTEYPKASIVREQDFIDKHAVQRAAIDDPDLKPLWDSMSGTMEAL